MRSLLNVVNLEVFLNQVTLSLCGVPRLWNIGGCGAKPPPPPHVNFDLPPNWLQSNTVLGNKMAATNLLRSFFLDSIIFNYFKGLRPIHTSTQYGARSTEYRVRSTDHGRNGTEHAARSDSWGNSNFPIENNIVDHAIAWPLRRSMNWNDPCFVLRAACSVLRGSMNWPLGSCGREEGLRHEPYFECTVQAQVYVLWFSKSRLKSQNLLRLKPQVLFCMYSRLDLSIGLKIKMNYSKGACVTISSSANRKIIKYGIGTTILALVLTKPRCNG